MDILAFISENRIVTAVLQQLLNLEIQGHLCFQTLQNEKNGEEALNEFEIHVVQAIKLEDWIE